MGRLTEEQSGHKGVPSSSQMSVANVCVKPSETGLETVLTEFC